MLAIALKALINNFNKFLIINKLVIEQVKDNSAFFLKRLLIITIAKVRMLAKESLDINICS